MVKVLKAFQLNNAFKFVRNVTLPYPSTRCCLRQAALLLSRSLFCHYVALTAGGGPKHVLLRFAITTLLLFYVSNDFAFCCSTSQVCAGQDYRCCVEGYLFIPILRTKIYHLFCFTDPVQSFAHSHRMDRRFSSHPRIVVSQNNSNVSRWESHTTFRDRLQVLGNFPDPFLKLTFACKRRDRTRSRWRGQERSSIEIWTMVRLGNARSLDDPFVSVHDRVYGAANHCCT